MRIFLLGITIISWGLWSFLQKICVERLHPLQMFVIGSSLGLITLPIYYYLLRNSNVCNPITVGNVLLCALASLLSSIGAIVYVYGVRTGEIGTIASISCAYPVLTVILAAIFLGEAITMSKLIGIALVMVGVVVLGR